MSHELVFYDGRCGLCHHSIRFLLARDRDGALFRYAPLFGETFEAQVPDEAREGLADSLVVLRYDGVLLQRASGVFQLLWRLGGFWGVVGMVGSWLPSRLTDWGYDRVAEVRHQLFERPAENCPLVPEELRSRFLP